MDRIDRAKSKKSDHSRRTSYARADASYDPDFRRHLAETIFTAIAEASFLTDADVLCLRIGETRDALVDCLISVMALTPFQDTPSHLCEFTEDLGKKIRRVVARFRANPPPEAERMFGFRNGGSA